jgi:hypothetical protein
MNNDIKNLVDQVGTDVSGKWISVDRADKFVGLVVEECCKQLLKEDIRHGGFGYNQYGLHDKLREHFGIK